MKIYEDLAKAKQKVTGAINKYGFSPDHNYYNYLYAQNAVKKAIFFDYGQSKGVVAFYNKKSNLWRVTNGVFANKKERLSILLNFLDWAFNEKKSRKVFAEFSEDFKSEIFNKFKNSYKLNVSYFLEWPIYNLNEFDEKLGGKRWKKLRNIRNRFYNNYKVEVKNPKNINRNELKNVLLSWTKKRYPRDRIDARYYLNIIENKFEGFGVLRAISLNGEACSFSGGWMVPNSNIFYYAVGIFNYKYKDFGDFVNLDDLLYAKKLGHTYVDFGGCSDRASIMFKRKFNPIKIYKTYFFSISPKH